MFDLPETEAGTDRSISKQARAMIVRGIARVSLCMSSISRRIMIAARWRERWLMKAIFEYGLRIVVSALSFSVGRSEKRRRKDEIKSSWTVLCLLSRTTTKRESSPWILTVSGGRYADIQTRQTVDA